MKVTTFRRHSAVGSVFRGPAIFALATFSLATLPMLGNDGSPSARQIFDKQLSAVEREVMGVVETMPAGKFNFVPTNGAFKTVRTFGVQARHIGFCLNEVAVALLGEPMLPHADQEGPKSLTSRDDIVQYLKDAFGRPQGARHIDERELAGADR